MLSGRFEDRFDLLLECAGAEQEDHDQGMGESNLCAIDDTVADGLEDHERRLVLRVEDDILE
jgi:hypothetical protein